METPEAASEHWRLPIPPDWRSNQTAHRVLGPYCTLLHDSGIIDWEEASTVVNLMKVPGVTDTEPLLEGQLLPVLSVLLVHTDSQKCDQATQDWDKWCELVSRTFDLYMFRSQKGPICFDPLGGCDDLLALFREIDYLTKRLFYRFEMLNDSDLSFADAMQLSREIERHCVDIDVPNPNPENFYSCVKQIEGIASMTKKFYKLLEEFSDALGNEKALTSEFAKALGMAEDLQQQLNAEKEKSKLSETYRHKYNEAIQSQDAQHEAHTRAQLSVVQSKFTGARNYIIKLKEELKAFRTRDRKQCRTINTLQKKLSVKNAPPVLGFAPLATVYAVDPSGMNGTAGDLHVAYANAKDEDTENTDPTKKQILGRVESFEAKYCTENSFVSPASHYPAIENDINSTFEEGAVRLALKQSVTNDKPKPTEDFPSLPRNSNTEATTSPTLHVPFRVKPARNKPGTN
ncbi:hypothetical protein BU23DRAFT_574705 [Bimuria novae-zelandiae CBS 107.79]|uniref:Uncharacterized protein n=1 Tax=Bimuria novae-zelandiae CBS 107.79 TaxID=1447943 RepID=A0A6A5UPF4_9PLEO|nr:hypothetical protein BU23DRAFT_574705 [Bimuria novae-zelandiae CBS 107.79]